MANYLRNCKSITLLFRLIFRFNAKWLSRPVLLVIIVFLTLLISYLTSLLRSQEIIHVLRADFSTIIRTVDTNYPSILEDDISGKIPTDLHQDVATRFKHHRGGQHKSPLKLLSVPQRQPSCIAMIKGNNAELTYASQFMEQNKASRPPLSRYSQAPSDCEGFIKSRGYITYALPEEKEFPIAYSIMMYRDADHAERLLRAIYRPHNYYCIHVDAKADKEIQEAMKGIAQCLPHVFLASKSNVVDWAQFNSLEPWLYCMQDLWKYSWKYFINLTGQEFPLKTNLQIVKILKALNGSNVVDTTTYGHYSRRWYDNMPPPFNIKPYKGLVFILASRGYVGYVIKSPAAKKLLEWVSHTDFPDETYFSSINHNPHLMVPGSYKGSPDSDAETKPYIARFVNWGVGWLDGEGRYPFSWPCGGKRVRRVCIFGIRDLQLLTNRRELFANKLLIDFEPLALDCLEEWHFNMTLVEYSGRLSIDTSWYENLDIVKNKVL